MKKGIEKFGIIATLFFVAIIIFSYHHKIVSPDDLLKVSFLDVGQGDAIFIEAPNGVQMLVDGGPDNKVLEELSKVMSFWDRSIDIVVATHPDKDHIGGLPKVFERFDVGMAMDTGVSSDTGIYREYDKQKKESGAELIDAKRGEVIVLDKSHGIYAEVLYPGDNTESVKDTNDTSIVLRIVYGESEVLLTGDASKKIEKFLVSRYGDRLDSDILKLGHHGSKTSTDELFLKAVSPEDVIVSAGESNSYGHPHPEVISLVKEYGSRISSTYESDLLSFYISPSEVTKHSR